MFVIALVALLGYFGLFAWAWRREWVQSRQERLRALRERHDTAMKPLIDSFATGPDRRDR